MHSSASLHGPATIGNPTPASASTASPLFWRQLFSLLRARRVIPVVGQDVLTVEDEHGTRTLNEYVARRLDEILLDGRPDERTPAPTLHEVACLYLEREGERHINQLYWAVQEILEERPIAVPDALRKLARIDAFTLYVSTTFDDLLRRAIDEERFGGRPTTQFYSYAPQRVQDLPAPLAELSGPTVYHLLGRHSASQEFVVTEEDTLEWVHSLQAEKRPDLLLDELRKHSLLIIGSGYSDWLMRFFLRIANKERLLMARSKTDIVADARARDDETFAHFLRYFGGQTKVFPGGTLQFVSELAERWEEHVATASPPEDAPRVPALRLADSGAEHAIFVSYASEDRAAAQRLADQLRTARLPVWFDREGGLEGGEDYEQKILASIRAASLFVPVLSQAVLTPEKRFFRIEWNAALEVERRVAANQSFIVPVRLDGVPQDSPQLPPRLRELHWMDAPAEADLDRVVQRLRDLYREYQRSLRGTT